MLKTTIIVIALGSTLTACTGRVDEHGARVQTDDFRIERDTHGYYDYPNSRSSKFCPPGQAKKGRC